MPSTALFIHVPVDKIEIVSARITSNRLRIHIDRPGVLPLPSFMAILRTDASKELFKRRIDLIGLSGDWVSGHRGQLSHYTFEGMFARQDIRGQLYALNDGKVTGEFRRLG